MRRSLIVEESELANLKLEVPPAIVNHIMQKKNVEILAKNLYDWPAHAEETVE